MKQFRWLSGIKAKITKARLRPARRSMRPHTAMLASLPERLEDRSLLSSATLFADGQLTVSTDANESVSIRVNPANTIRLQVLINNVPSPNAPSVLTSQLTAIVITTGDSENVVDLSAVTAGSFVNLTSVTINTGNGHDFITGSPDLPDLINGGNGEDTVFGLGGNDTLIGGDGLDSIQGGAGADLILGGDGDDLLSGDVGEDTIDSGDGADLVTGNDGNDSLTAGQGTDTVDGGLGNDFVIGNAGRDSLNGGDGDDTLYGGSDHDTLIGGVGLDWLTGNGGNDTLLGGDGGDSLEGGAGVDSLSGEAGNDYLLGGLGNDIQVGGNGNDTMLGGGGDDQLAGDSIDGLSADIGNDILSGQSGDDTLLGGLGSDTLDGGTGNDLLNTARVIPTPPPPPPPAGPPAVFIGDIVLPAEGNAGTSSAIFNISLSHAASTTITMSFSTVDGIAVAGSDFQAQTGTLTFAPGQTAATVTVLVNGDASSEPAEDFSVTLSNAVGANILDGIGRAIIPAEDQNLTTLTVAPQYAASYNAVSFGSIPGLPPLYGGLTIDPANPNVLLVGGNANTAAGALYAIPLLRDAFGHIAGVTGTATQVATAAFNDGGIVFGPNGVLFAARWPVNELGQYLPGSSTPDRIIDMSTLGVTNSLSALQFVPTGFNGAGRMKLVTWPTGDFYDATFASAGDGTFLVTAATQTATIPGGPEGIVYVPQGSPLFPQQSLLIAEFSAGQVSSYQIDANGNPIVATRQPFLQNLTGAEGAFIDPISGDFLFTTFGGGNQLVAVQGFASTIPDITINDVTVNENDSGTVNATFTVTATGNISGPVSVNYLTGGATAAGNQDFANATGQLTFTPGNLTQTITVAVNGDLFDEPDETFFINLFNATGATVSDNQATGTIVDNDPTIPPDTLPDLLRGGDGFDTILGSENDDTINGEAGNDTIFGNGGADTIYGGAGDDLIDGGTGTDLIFGNSGTDTINSGDADDTVVWRGISDGSDFVSSSNGADTVIVRGTDAADTFTVLSVDGQIAVAQGTASIVLDASVNSLTVNADDGNDLIVVNDISQVGLSNLTINGEVGNDFINASNSGDTGFVILSLNGGIGNDVIRGGARHDIISGGAGNDILQGNAGDDEILGDEDDDLIHAGTGNDIVDGGIGNDSVFAGDGNDFANGGLGNDSLDGQSGDDTLKGGFDNDVVIGSAGDDSVGGESGNDMVIGGAGNDTIEGGRNDDTLQGNSGNDVLRGDHGNDLVFAGEGNDIISGGDGNDTVQGGDGDDFIHAGDGSDYVLGQLGRDTLIGSDGNDTLVGGGSSDTLLGNQGDDVLQGNGGTDLASGGEGSDNDLTAVSASVEIIDETFVFSSPLSALL